MRGCGRALGFFADDGVAALLRPLAGVALLSSAGLAGGGLVSTPVGLLFGSADFFGVDLVPDLGVAGFLSAFDPAAARAGAVDRGFEAELLTVTGVLDCGLEAELVLLGVGALESPAAGPGVVLVCFRDFDFGVVEVVAGVTGCDETDSLAAGASGSVLAVVCESGAAAGGYKQTQSGTINTSCTRNSVVVRVRSSGIFPTNRLICC